MNKERAKVGIYASKKSWSKQKGEKKKPTGDIKLQKRHKLSKPKMSLLLLGHLTNWVKVTTQTGKKYQGRLITIDSIEKEIHLHSDRIKVIRFKQIKKIKSLGDRTFLPKRYRKRLRLGEKNRKIKNKSKQKTDANWFP